MKTEDSEEGVGNDMTGSEWWGELGTLPAQVADHVGQLVP
jgi:hypothetical protein